MPVFVKSFYTKLEVLVFSLCRFDFCAGFVMDNHLNRHTYGFIQSRLVPFYLHLGSACAFLNLTIYTVYHPRDMLNDRESFQVPYLFYFGIKSDYDASLSLNLCSYFASRFSSSLYRWQLQPSTRSGLARWHQRSWQTCILLNRPADWVRILDCRPTAKLTPNCARWMQSTESSAVACGCTDCCRLCVTFAA